MNDLDRKIPKGNFKTEFFLTVFLLMLLASLFLKVMPGYGAYIALSLGVGFSFSWFARDRQPDAVKVVVNILILGALAWIIRSLLNSSLFYRDVIMVAAKGVFMLEAALSFGASYAVFLPYVQALSIPLFMTYPVLSDEHTVVSVVSLFGYVLGLFLLVNIKFHALFESGQPRPRKLYYPYYFAAAFLVAGVFLAWIVFSRVWLERMDKGGILPDTDTEAQLGIEAMEKEYYGLQDKIQDKVTRMIPSMKDTKDRYETIAFLNSFIKDSPDTAEVYRARDGLISRMKTPGPGPEKKDSENFTISAQRYLDLKIISNLRKNKDSIIDSVKRNPFGMKERLDILTRLNRMRRASSLGNLESQSAQLADVALASSAPEDVKRQMRNDSRSFKEWKAFEMYLRKLKELNSDKDALEPESRAKAQQMLSAVKNAQIAPEFKEAAGEISRAKNNAPEQARDFFRKMEEALDLKFEMIVSGRAYKLRETMKGYEVGESQLKELNDSFDAVVDARDPERLSVNVADFRKELKESGLRLQNEFKEFFKMKSQSMLKKSREKIDEIIKEGVLLKEGAKEFMAEVERLTSSVRKEDLRFLQEKVLEAVSKLSQDGFISPENKEALNREVNTITELISLEIGLEGEIREQEDRSNETPDEIGKYQDALTEILKNSPLSQEKKDELTQLMRELRDANSLEQIENVMQVQEALLEGLTLEGMSKEEKSKIDASFGSVGQIKKLFIIERALSGLTGKIDDLGQVSPDAAEALDDLLKNIRESSTDEQLRLRINKMVEYINAQADSGAGKTMAVEDAKAFRIYILPLRLTIPAGRGADLKVLAVYNNKFIKDIVSDLEWSTTDALIAWVDEKAILHASSRGKARIWATYKGIKSRSVVVTVVESMAPDAEQRVKDEL